MILELVWGITDIAKKNVMEKMNSVESVYTIIQEIIDCYRKATVNII